MSNNSPPSQWFWLSDGSFGDMGNLDRMPIHHKSLEKKRITRKKRLNADGTERTRTLPRSRTMPVFKRGSTQANIDTPTIPAEVPLYLTDDYDYDKSSESEPEQDDHEINDREDKVKSNRKEEMTISQTVYLTACEREQVVVKAKMTKGLATDTLAATPCLLNSEDIRMLSYALVTNTCVSTVDFSRNTIGLDGVNCLVQMLEENLTITSLNLSHCSLALREVCMLAEMLSDNHRLQDFSLAGNELDDESAKHLAEALKFNRKLKYLDLSGNHIHELGGKLLAKSIEGNDGLQTVNMSWNHIRLTGATAWGEAVLMNEELLDLNLSWNGFCDDGAQLLGSALEVNQFLQYLDLSSNRIGYDGCYSLSRGLVVNKVLKTLKLCQNPVTTQGTLILLTSLTDNPESKLELLDVQGMQVVHETDDLVKQIEDQREFVFIHSGYVQSPDLIVATATAKPDKRCKSAK